MGEGEDILGCVAGYGVGLDLTARDIQCRLKEKGLPWLKAKGFRHSACVSDFVAANKVSSQSFFFSLRQNGILRQRGNTEMMIYPLRMVLCELVLSYGLKKGDLVFTGTPSGVGKISEGDRLELELDGLAEAFFYGSPKIRQTYSSRPLKNSSEPPSKKLCRIACAATWSRTDFLFLPKTCASESRPSA